VQIAAIIRPLGSISSDGDLPCSKRYFFLLQSDMLGPLQYLAIKPLQASSLEEAYFWKKPHLSSNSHRSAISIVLSWILLSYIDSGNRNLEKFSGLD
jgi:hypothetical protein